MKRIVRLINLYPPYVVGGNEMLNRDITDALLERGYDVHIVTAHGRELAALPYVHQCFNYDLDEEMEDLFRGGRRLSLGAHFRHHVFDRVTYREVRQAVRELEPDLVVAGNLYMASAAPLLAVRDFPCPVVAEVADKWLLFNLVDWGMVVNPTTRLQKLVVEGVRGLVQRPLAKCVRLDGIATVSNFIRDLYIQADFDPQTMETMYLGIHTDVFRPGPSHPLNDPVRLVFIGSLWKGKGPQVIIRAMRLLHKMHNVPDLHLDLFGEGSSRFKNYLHSEIEGAGLEDNVTFQGFVPWERLVEVMHRSDVFIFSSIWDEPFAITPLQAMGCGLPVVAARAGGTAEGFVDGETALLVPPDDAEAMADAVARLVRDDSMRTRLRENGIREARERWSFDAYMDRLVDFYQRVDERWRKAERSEE